MKDSCGISWKIGAESMPAHGRFFKRAVFGRSRNAIGCFIKRGYNAGCLLREGPHVIAAPHNLPAKLLLRMRREDRASALACMDQPQVLRYMFSYSRQGLLAAKAGSNRCSVGRGNSDRTRQPPRAPTANHRASGSILHATDRSNSITHAHGSGLHLRRAHEER